MITEDKVKKKVKEGFIGQRMVVLPPDVKKTVLKNELTKRLYATAIGYYPNAVSHNRERKTGSNQYILLYCVAGSGIVNIADKSFKIVPHQFIILPRNIAHSYSATLHNPWTIYWIHFTGENSDLLYNRFIENNSEPVFTAYNEHHVNEFELILSLFENSFEMRYLELANIKLQSYLSNLIYAEEINPNHIENDKVSNSIAFMKKKLNANLSLQELAKEQNLSFTHYSRIFRAKTGRSPNQYFNELKIQKSCQFLYFTNMNIKEICVELGFADPYYFSRLFKKLMGIAPAVYKKQHKRF